MSFWPYSHKLNIIAILRRNMNTADLKYATPFLILALFFLMEAQALRMAMLTPV